MNIILTLTFSMVVLFFMLFPAIKITEWIDKHLHLPQKLYTPVTIFITILLSITIGIFLNYA